MRCCMNSETKLTADQNSYFHKQSSEAEFLTLVAPIPKVDLAALLPGDIWSV